MKYIIYAVNYNTLLRAIRYMDDQWGKENCHLIYAELDGDFPARVAESYSSTRINGHNRREYNGVKGNLIAIDIARRSWRALDRLLKGTTRPVTLVVFRDNEPQEAMMIERAFRKYGDRLHLYVMEEGVGIYATQRVPIKAQRVKALAFRLCGISDYALSPNPQGLNPHTEKIICMNPDIIADKLRGRSIVVEQMLDAFTPSNNERFVRLCLGGNIKRKTYRFVFLTIPIHDLPESRFHGTTQTYIETVGKILNVAAAYGNVLIKLHPRDLLDYSRFESDQIQVCTPEEYAIPYECLATWFGMPQMISAYSSASINSKSGKTNYYVSDILGIVDGGRDLPDAFYQANGIQRCDTLEALDACLRQDSKERQL